MKIRVLAIASAVVALTTACNDNKLTAAAVAGDPPTAVITGSQSYGPLDTAVFSGASSTAVAPKTIANYEWAISGHPNGSQSVVQLGSDPSAAEFFVDLAGDYKIKLKVTDSSGVSDTTEYAFSAVPSQSLHIELTWPAQYTQADMDLHLINKGVGGSMWSSSEDCDFITCKPTFGGVLDWGVSGNTNDDPTLDIDNINEAVPENINIKAPVDGTYEVNVHYYASHGAGDVVCHVRVYLGGTVAWEGEKTLSSANQVWTVGDVAWSSGNGTFNEIGTIFTTTGP